jgi:catechol 2,3-dioxygenase-like lactoylglutathione lyase family enzyme
VRAHLIVFVSDQEASTQFFRQVLGAEPSLHVDGMTEFVLGEDCVLGLMPEAGVRRLLDLDAPRAGLAAELYLHVDDPAAFHARAVGAGATELSPLQLRDWGDEVAYSRTTDGLLLAFARTAAAVLSGMTG